jgi:3-oxoadipate enol-lactonase
MPTIQANGIDVFYRTQGAGDPLLLIAGFGCDHTIWGKVIPTLASHYRVVLLDNRGTGRTTGADSLSSIRQMALDAAGLLDALGMKSVHVAGHSMGGLIAQELALARPTLVQTLSLLSSCSRVDERGKAIIEAWGDLPRQVDAATTTRLIMPWVYTNNFYATPGAVEQVIEQVLSNPVPATAEGLYRQSRAISAANTSDRLNELRCPTLVLVGSEDILIPVSFSEHLARAIPGAELVVLEKSGHGLLIESPDAVATAILDFLSRHRTTRSVG